MSSSFTDVPPGLKSWQSCSLFCTTRRTSSGAMRFLPVVWATSPASSRMFDVKYSSTLVRNESAEELRRLECNSSRRKRSTRLKGSSPLWERVLSFHWDPGIEFRVSGLALSGFHPLSRLDSFFVFPVLNFSPFLPLLLCALPLLPGTL